MTELLIKKSVKHKRKIERIYTHYNIDQDFKGVEFVRLHFVDIYEVTTDKDSKFYELQECFKNVYTPLNSYYTPDFDYLDYNISISKTLKGASFYDTSKHELYKNFYHKYQYYQITKDNKHLFKNYEHVFKDDLIIKYMFDDIDRQLSKNKYILNSFTPFVVVYDWDLKHVYEVTEKLKDKYNLVIKTNVNKSNDNNKSYVVSFHDLDK